MQTCKFATLGLLGFSIYPLKSDWSEGVAGVAAMSVRGDPVRTKLQARWRANSCEWERRMGSGLLRRLRWLERRGDWWRKSGWLASPAVEEQITDRATPLLYWMRNRKSCAEKRQEIREGRSKNRGKTRAILLNRFQFGIAFDTDQGNLFDLTGECRSHRISLDTRTVRISPSYTYLLL